MREDLDSTLSLQNWNPEVPDSIRARRFSLALVSFLRARAALSPDDSLKASRTRVNRAMQCLEGLHPDDLPHFTWPQFYTLTYLSHRVSGGVEGAQYEYAQGVVELAGQLDAFVRGATQ